MRLTIAAAVACLIGGISLADDARAAVRMPTNIPAQNLGAALQTLARGHDVQLVYFSNSIDTLGTQGAVGELTIDEALGKLLSGSGLIHRYLDENTITIVPHGTGAPASELTSASQAADPKSEDSAQSQKRIALEEIVVSAQKRSERLQDVPVPVSAIRADTLVANNQLRLEDYYSRILGLSVTPSDDGAPQLTIRGVTTGGYSNPTVGIVVDDVPFGPSSALAYGNEAPDIDPSDLARVEVLRGPQGTLYGSSSIGGLLKFVTVDPSTEELAGRVQVGLSSVRNGDDVGYNMRGAVNVPLSDTWAVRASGFSRREPGYIDDPTLGIQGVNQVDAKGGRLSALWQPSADLSLKLSALVQDSEGDGISSVDRQSGLGDLQQARVRGGGGFDKKNQAYSATLTARFGVADFTSATGYGVREFASTSDLSNAFGGITSLLFGVDGATVVQDLQTKKFTQEFRVNMPLGQHFDWLVGAFYNHEDSEHTQHDFGVVPATGVAAGEFLATDNPSTFTEIAAFTDLTYHITDRFDVQFGGRQSRNRQTYMQTFDGPIVPLLFFTEPPFVQPEVRANANTFTYLVTPRFKVTPDLMLYARLASGYRAGGPNFNSTALGLPASYSPDKTENFEVGVKGDIFAGLLSFDASVYYIDWKDIQLQLIDPNGLTYYTNASRAKSQGLELSLESRPLDSLTVAGWVAWNEAELTEDFPDGSLAYGVSGDRLPYSSRFSGSISLDQEFNLLTSVTVFVGGAVSYVGDRQGVFTGSADRQTFPAYVRTDVRAGVRYDAWTVNLFVNNVTDRRGMLTGGLGTNDPVAFYYIQPRTAGLSLSKTF